MHWNIKEGISTLRQEHDYKTKEETVKSVKRLQHVQGVTTAILTVIIGAKHYIIGYDNAWVGVTRQAHAAEATIIFQPFHSLISLS